VLVLALAPLVLFGPQPWEMGVQIFSLSSYEELSAFFEPHDPFVPVWFGIPYWLVLSVVLLALWLALIGYQHDPKP